MAFIDMAPRGQLCLRHTFIDVDDAQPKGAARRAQSSPSRSPTDAESSASEEDRTYVADLSARMSPLWEGASAALTFFDLEGVRPAQDKSESSDVVAPPTKPATKTPPAADSIAKDRCRKDGHGAQ